jgi:hypothetical protein
MTNFNQTVIDAAERIAEATQRDFLNIRNQGAVTLSAVAGAGKSHLVTDTVEQCRRRGMRVAVAAPTNEQVFSLVHSIAANTPTGAVAFLPATGIELPSWARRPNILVVSPAHQASGETIVVGTLHKLASAIHPRNKSTPALRNFDALIIDESYQASSSSYFALASIAPRHLCVGDSGQILPFSTVEAGRQWKGLAEDPLQTAVGVLRANHPDTPQYRFPITRRLDPRGVAIAKHFYPVDHEFGAAIADGVRTMRLGRATAVGARERTLDEALALAARCGWAYVEQSASQTLVADPDTAQLLVDLVARLCHRTARLGCERHARGVELAPGRIAVAVSHNDQKNLVRGMLDNAGLVDVMVNTANKLQGLEFDLTVCWHPLAGLDEADAFHLEAGRLCVMCTRHRHACIVVGRSGDRELVEGLPPSTPAYPDAGADTDDVLRGWEVHRHVFAGLKPYLIQMH